MRWFDFPAAIMNLRQDWNWRWCRYGCWYGCLYRRRRRYWCGYRCRRYLTSWSCGRRIVDNRRPILSLVPALLLDESAIPFTSFDLGELALKDFEPSLVLPDLPDKTIPES